MGSKYGKNVLMGVGGVVGIAVLGTTVLTGIYAYNNPDPEKCWVIRDLDSSETTRVEAISIA